jgi:hypothetical protein
MFLVSGNAYRDGVVSFLACHISVQDWAGLTLLGHDDPSEQGLEKNVDAVLDCANPVEETLESRRVFGIIAKEVNCLGVILAGASPATCGNCGFECNCHGCMWVVGCGLWVALRLLTFRFVSSG